MTKEITETREAQTDEEMEKVADAKDYNSTLSGMASRSIAGNFVGIATAIGASTIINSDGDMKYIGAMVVGAGIFSMVAIQLLGKMMKDKLVNLRENKILQVREAESVDEKKATNEALKFHENLNAMLFNSVYTFLSGFTINFGAGMIPKGLNVGSILPNMANIPQVIESIPIGAVVMALGVAGTLLAYKANGRYENNLKELYDDKESKMR